VRDWFFRQRESLDARLAEARPGPPVCRHEDQQLYVIPPRGRAQPAGRGELALFHDRLACAGFTFPLKDLEDLAITGQMTLTFTACAKRYEVKSPYPRSAVLYRHAFLFLTRRPPD
jgi:hypothetical protein